MFDKSLFIFITAYSDLNREIWSNIIARKLTKLTGGCTKLDQEYPIFLEGTGYYQNTRGNIDYEGVTVIWSVCENPQQVFDEIRPLLSKYCRVCTQECVLSIVSGNPEFISQDNLF